MSSGFEAVSNPSSADLAGLATSAPESPFHTAAYAAARGEMGDQVVLLALREADGRLAAGCTAFARKGRLGGHLDLPSARSAPDAFWEGVVAHCRRRRQWRIYVGTFGAPVGTHIPPLPGEQERRPRAEHVVSLADFRTEALSTNHRRSIKKARAGGVTFEVRREPAVALEHVALMDASMDRRAGRGEDVSRTDGAAQATALLRTGAGVCARAVRGGETLSSMLVLLAEKGGYYHSAGTSPAGMATGASPFLVAEVAAWLKAEGRSSFNLGGAMATEEGLHRFKRGFGGVEIPLEAVTVDLSPALVRLLRSLSGR